MEIIKRKILLENSIDRSYNSPTYGAVTATSFYINVFLTQNIDDMGMFTDTEFIPTTQKNSQVIENYDIRLTGKTVSDYYNYGNQVISTITESRAEDVRNYKSTLPYRQGFDVNSETYTNYRGEIVNGVDRVTYLNPLTYVFGADKTDTGIGKNNQKNGLLFVDFTGNTELSNISYVGEGWNMTNISHSALTKEEYLFGIISQPEVENDVFIDRGITKVLERHLKLSEIRNLGELSRYGNGYYNLTIQ